MRNFRTCRFLVQTDKIQCENGVKIGVKRGKMGVKSGKVAKNVKRVVHSVLIKRVSAEDSGRHNRGSSAEITISIFRKKYF